MKRALTAAEMRAVDTASGQHGVPSSVLMQYAGEALTRAALREAGQGGRFLLLCGPGNNGGDGLVAARKLSGLGRPVFLELVADEGALRGEASRALEALRAAGVTSRAIPKGLNAFEGDVVIDALLGTGLNRAPEGRIAEAIKRIAAWRAAGARVVSADLPSGLNSDTGSAFAPCVQADVTVSFGHVKVGQILEPGLSLCGRLEVADIGIPRAAEQVLGSQGVFLLEEADVRCRIPKRRADSHKGTYGHVLIVGGSLGKTGAAALAALGALRGGAGLVTVATQSRALDAVMQHAPEVMGVELRGDGPLSPSSLDALLEAAAGKSAVVLGPGLERGEDTHVLLGSFLQELSCPCVIDAGGLSTLSGHLELLRRAKSELLLTPHPGEMSQLLALSTAHLQNDRVSVARDFAREHRVMLILKGARTLIARGDGSVFVNATGNPGMATGGTGDVLAGLLGGLLGQGFSAEDAALAGTWVHGLAGDAAKDRRGEMGLIASDLLDGLGDVWRRWSR